MTTDAGGSEQTLIYCWTCGRARLGWGAGCLCGGVVAATEPPPDRYRRVTTVELPEVIECDGLS